MEKEFIPYSEALALKELGFDEPCFSRYCIKTVFEEPTGEILLQNTDCKIYENRFLTKAPLYQQAFRWFREKYNIECYVNCYWNEVDSSKRDYYANYNYGSDIFYSINIGFKNYEEAELECLKKLIEIVKNK